MPLSPTWTDIAIRLALTLLAGAAIGLNRGARGHAAGFRTTILVCLAASVAMIQANILLPLSGKTPESFAVMDLMRLPLGILTGVDFIGGGTIRKRGDLVTGVTTAATLWLVTVIGLCFGGGQLVLGAAATVLAVITLWVLKWVDVMIPREHRARLVVVADLHGLSSMKFPGCSPNALPCPVPGAASEFRSPQVRQRFRACLATSRAAREAARRFTFGDRARFRNQIVRVDHG
jgi:uncharacterized membrane protein YhiD involved in acid resistance